VVHTSSSLKSPLNDDDPVLEIGGQFRFRMEENRKRDFQNNTGFSSLRLRPLFVFRPQSTLSFQWMPQVIQEFGKPEWVPSTASANSLNATSGTNRDPLLSVHQAFGELRLGASSRLFVGRQMFSYGDQVLLGPSDWENPGRSFDAIRLRFESSKSWADVFSAKIWDTNTQESAKGDKDFHGAYLSWGAPESTVEIQPYLFWLRDHRSSLFQIFSAGMHSKMHFSGLDIKGEATGQWGDQTGQQAWLELGFPSFLGGNVQVNMDGFWASEAFNPLFPSVHHLLGWADVLGRRNLAGLGLKVGLNTSTSTRFVVRGIHFVRVNTEKPPYGADGVTPLTFTSGSSQVLGSELDLIGHLALMPSAHLEPAVSVFFAGDPLRESLGQTWAARFETSLLVAF